MNKEVFVFEVTQSNFDQAVILNSHKIPVFVEFMGVWSSPCAQMEYVFSDLAKEFSEQFIFAKVDIDEQEALSKQYEIKNIPALLVFRDGKIIRTEVGELKEKEAREILKDVGIYHDSDLKRDQAREKHLAGETAAAILLLTEAIKADPSNVRVVMDMIQIFIDINELEQANGLFAKLPKPVHETEMGKALSGQLIFASLAAKTEDIETLQKKLEADIDDYDARFNLSLRQIADYQYGDAIENLFYIAKKENAYKEGAAQEMLITVANMLAPVDSKLAQEIRQKLGSVLAN